MTDTPKLKPCMFCGNESVKCRSDWMAYPVEYMAYVECSRCDARGPLSEYKYDNKSEAIEDGSARWNALATTHQSALDRIAEQDKRIAELEGALEEIARYRADCHAYDDDAGHERRSFDDGGWMSIEGIADGALFPNTTDPMKDIQAMGQEWDSDKGAGNG